MSWLLSKNTKISINIIKLTKANNSHDIHVLEYDIKKTEFYQNQNLIADYLQNCSNIKTFYDIIAILNFFLKKYEAFWINK